MVWIAVYPIVLIVLSLLGDSLRGWPLPLRVMGATLLIVPIVTNVSEPAVRKIFSMFEHARAQRR